MHVKVCESVHACFHAAVVLAKPADDTTRAGADQAVLVRRSPIARGSLFGGAGKNRGSRLFPWAAAYALARWLAQHNNPTGKTCAATRPRNAPCTPERRLVLRGIILFG